MRKLFLWVGVSLLFASGAQSTPLTLSTNTYSDDPAASNYIGNATEDVVDWKDILTGAISGEALGVFFTSLGDYSRGGYFASNTDPGYLAAFSVAPYNYDPAAWILSPQNSILNGSFNGVGWHDTGWTAPVPPAGHPWVQGDYWIGQSTGERKAVIYGNPVPEPSTALLLGIGLAGLGMRRRRR